MSIPQLSTGQPSTLRTYYRNCIAIFGTDSAATQFIAEKIAEDGEDAVVIQHETQMLHLLMNLHNAGLTGGKS